MPQDPHEHGTHSPDYTCEECRAGKPVVTGPVDGNAFAVMGAVIKALKAAGQGDKVDAYKEKAMSGDYNTLLQVSMEYVDFDL